MEAPLWTPSYKVETNLFPSGLPFSLYTWQLNLGQNIWNKHKCYWECLREQPGEPQGNRIRTLWEHMRSKKRKPKINSPHPTPKMKKAGPILGACWAFPLAAWKSIPKTVCHHFRPGLMAGAEIEQGRKTKNNSH